MKSYKTPKYDRGTIVRKSELEGETIEKKVARILNNKEPIKDGAPLIYTERNEGIKSAYNIRTDRWEVATDAMDVVTRTAIAKRQGKAEETKVIQMEKKISGAESTQGTEQQ